MALRETKKSTVEGPVVPPQHRAAYSRIANLLASNGVIAKHLGQLLDRGQQEAFAKVLFELTRRANTSLRVVRELLDLEFARKVGGEENTILRENSLCTKFITFYSLHEAAIYLKLAFSPLVVEIISTEDDAVDDEWYLNRVDHIFDAIREDEMIDRMPRSIRAIVASILEMAERYVPERRYPLMAGYLFLRLYNPCLSSPANFGMVNDAMISPTARQRLLVITKALQHLSNNTTPKDNPKLGKWIEDMQPEMEAFLDIVCSDDIDPPFSDQLEQGRSLSVDELDRETLIEMAVILQENRPGLEAVRKRLLQSDSGDLVTIYDDLIKDVESIGPLERVSTGPRSPRDGQVGGASQATKAAAASSSSSSSVGGEDPSSMRQSSDSSKAPPQRSPRLRNPVDADARDSGRTPASSTIGDPSSSGGKQNMRTKVKGLFSSSKGEKEKLAALEKTKSGEFAGEAKQAVVSNSLALAGLSEAFAATIPRDDLGECSNVTVFVLLRGFVSSQTLVAKGMEFVASNALGWLASTLNLGSRKSGLTVCQRWETLGLIVRAEDAPDGLRFQDDDSLYKVVSWRYKVWDALVGKKWSSEHDAFCAQVSSMVLEWGSSSIEASRGSPNLKSSGAEGPREAEMMAWGASLMSHADFGMHGKLSSKVAVEWLRVYGDLAPSQAVEFLHRMKSHQRAQLVLPNELRDQSIDDIVFMMQFIAIGFVLQRGGPRSRLWDRDSMVALISGVDLLSDGSFLSTREASDVALEASLLVVDSMGIESHTCKLHEWHPSLQAMAGKGSSKPPSYWLGLWKRLEACEFLKRKCVVAFDQDNGSPCNAVFWLVTTMGEEFLLERQAYVWSSFTIDASAIPGGLAGSAAGGGAGVHSPIAKPKTPPPSEPSAGEDLARSNSRSLFGRAMRSPSSVNPGGSAEQVIITSPKGERVTEDRKSRRSVEVEWRESSEGASVATASGFSMGEEEPSSGSGTSKSGKGLPKLLGRMKKTAAVQTRDRVASSGDRNSIAKSAPGPLKAIDVSLTELDELEATDNKQGRALKSPNRERQGSDAIGGKGGGSSSGTPLAGRHRNGSDAEGRKGSFNSPDGQEFDGVLEGQRPQARLPSQPTAATASPMVGTRKGK